MFKNIIARKALKDGLSDMEKDTPGFAQAYFALAKLEEIMLNSDMLPIGEQDVEQFECLARAYKQHPERLKSDFGVEVEFLWKRGSGKGAQSKLSVEHSFKGLLAKMKPPKMQQVEQRASDSWREAVSPPATEAKTQR